MEVKIFVRKTSRVPKHKSQKPEEKSLEKEKHTEAFPFSPHMGLGSQPALCSEGICSAFCSRLEGMEQERRKPTKQNPKAHKHRQQVTVAAASFLAGESRYRTSLQYAPVLRNTEGNYRMEAVTLTKRKKTCQISILDQAQD